MAQKYYAAADIGGTKVALGLFGEDKTLVGKGQFASDPGLPGEAFFTQVVEELRALCREHEVDPAGLAGVGHRRAGDGEVLQGPGGPCAPCCRGSTASRWRSFVTSLLPGVKVGGGQRRPLRGPGRVPPGGGGGGFPTCCTAR